MKCPSCKQEMNNYTEGFTTKEIGICANKECNFYGIKRHLIEKE